jgi:hypothetical protein
MITRIHGASSTLAANPPRKHRRAKKRKNGEKKPRVVKTVAEQIAATKRRLQSLTGGIQKKKTAKQRREERAAKGLAPLKRKVKLSAEQIAARRQKAAERAANRAATDATKAFRKEFGYALKKLPEGATAQSYAYYNKKGKRYTSSPRLIKGMKPKFTIYKGASGNLGLHKNPAIGKLVVAGVPVVNMAIGSVAAIAVGMISQKLIAKYAPSVASSPVGDITGELATAGIAAYLHGSKVLKNPMHKSIAQFAFIGAVFQILSKKATAYVGPLVDKIPGLSGHEGYTGGVYFDPYTASQAVGGVYLPTDMGGMYASVDQSTEMGGLGLFKAPSIYG